jgi:hypothetical protein
MTTITLDPQPDSPKSFSTDALTAPRSVAPPQSPLNKTRLVCEWKRTADGRMTSTWTLRDQSPARMPELSLEDGPRACAFEDGIAIASQRGLLVWIWQHPRQVRTILWTAAVVVFLGLVTADLSRSTTANSRQTSQVCVLGNRDTPLLHEHAQQCDGTVAQQNGLAATE